MPGTHTSQSLWYSDQSSTNEQDSISCLPFQCCSKCSYISELSWILYKVLGKHGMVCWKNDPYILTYSKSLCAFSTSTLDRMDEFGHWPFPMPQLRSQQLYQCQTNFLPNRNTICTEWPHLAIQEVPTPICTIPCLQEFNSIISLPHWSFDTHVHQKL